LTTTVKIGTRTLNQGESAYVIAEVGSNHDRDLEIAHKLIDVAADARADAVKFQTYSADALYSRYAPRLSEMDEYGRSPEGESPYEMIKNLELPREWQRELKDHASEREIDFISTPFDLPAVDELEALDVAAFKIASYEIVDYDLLAAAASKGRPMIISTGGSSLADVERAVAVIEGQSNHQIVILHCVSQYPAEIEDLNMRAMQTLGHAFGYPVGFSDHSLGNVAAVVAIALGATCLEKHFTLDPTRTGPDHPTAADPDQLADYIDAVRTAERSLGTAIKRVQDSEEENHRLAKRSIHATVDIPIGTAITPEMLILKRPGLGIHPSMKDVVVGRTAARDIKQDEWITWEMV
jgi:sialic acid synthase SpsE